MCMSLSLATAPAATTPRAATAAMLVLLLLSKVLSQRTHDGTANSTQEAVSGLVATPGARSATTQSAEQTTVLFGHRRSVGIVIGSIGIGRLARSLRVLLCALTLRLVVEGAFIIVHPSLVGCVGIIALRALRIATVVTSTVVAGLRMLESAVLRRTEGVLATRGAEVLVLVVASVTTLLRRITLLAMALLRWVSLAILLLLAVVALLVVAATATVRIVWATHSVCGGLLEEVGVLDIECLYALEK